ncbi:hypothetical protein F4X88_04480 [Candidatus Poribacteria bacterium]|nr:hypothetical protein [Candidatus Poribacteria bacterium]MYA55532.1 hypothetical protein [Candidatus Poribacteria bacterium]
MNNANRSLRICNAMDVIGELAESDAHVCQLFLTDEFLRGIDVSLFAGLFAGFGNLIGTFSI